MTEAFPIANFIPRPCWKLTFLLFLSQIFKTEESEPCATYTSCDSCSGSSILCHWCPDGSCHAVSSPYGCAYGSSCYDNTKCLRVDPEFQGYGRPSFFIILAVAVFGGILVLCAISAIILARDFAHQNVPDEEDYCDYYETLSNESDEDYFSIERDNSFLRESTLSKVKVSGINEGRGWRFGGSKRGRTKWRGRAKKYQFAGRLYSFVAFSGSCFILLVLAAGSLILIFAPHSPVVNVCSTKFDWGSIYNTMKSAQVEADFQILSSIYNPNFLDLEIQSGAAVLRHKHIEVGQIIFQPFVARGGYTTDTLLVAQIDADVWKDLMLGYEYETNILGFFMDGSVSASISWHGHSTLPMTFAISNYYIKVTDAEEIDRSLCNCPSV